ncbi:FAD-dependent oxidoreductase [Mesorhizobium sp.]|uniref:FAD-dependent oxidoreductase n=1 Tax=Mesorhizobium sp. TaxID=1871066 RepID=UPI000FE4D7DB|nr:FAD-dependent oxidoreductase [Mesorhizobium sp.]RWK43694.1 MAG: FAD-dependent oxidoreductase [Mesorhizobium sp.]
MGRYQYQHFGYVPPPELSGRAAPSSYPVVIVGAGPIGLAMAIDLAVRGIASVVLDDNDVVSVGSRAICWAKRTLEIFDRLGVGERIVAKGVTWKIGRVFHGDREVYDFDLLPEDGHKMPAFVNLQQYYVEQYLVERAREFPDLIDLRFKNKVTSVRHLVDVVTVSVETLDGPYQLTADYLLACDGAKSLVRAELGLEFAGKLFEERFLIADIELKADFPSERRFWFEPTFHAGQSALLHKQPDDIYRIDLQLGWDADPEVERQPENVLPRIERVLGRSDFELDWVSVYTFQCRRLERFVHDRVIFVGDSAHVVSPFGARGGNGGIQDVDNLGWKLVAVLKGHAPEALLSSYDDERIRGADENIANSSRATNFMTPKSAMEKILRDEVLDLAGEMPFARRLVNSGRLSVPCSLAGLPLQTPSADAVLEPGSPCRDAPLRKDGEDVWLLNQLGDGFALLSFGSGPRIEVTDIAHVHVARPGEGELQDVTGHAFERYGDGMTYLIRPDQHVAAAFRIPDAAAICAARDRALARP